VVTFIGMLVAPEPVRYFPERFKGFIQLIYSVTIGLLFFFHLKSWLPEYLAKLFLIFIIFILIGSALEIYTPFNIFSDTFRNLVYKRSIYESNFRDIYLYGQIRPKLFTQEPSYVALFFVLASFVWFTSTQNMYRYSILILFTALGLLLIRSPTVILIIPLAFIVEIFIRKSFTISMLIIKKKQPTSLSVFIWIAIFLLLSIVAFHTILSNRIDQFSAGRDSSTKARITGAVYIIANTIKQYPLWGSGITGKESIEKIIKKTYWSVNVRHSSVYSFTANFLIMFFVYYGILGSVLFIAGIITFFRRLHSKNWIFITISIFIFSQAMGAFVGARTWSYIFIILTISSYSERFQDNNQLKSIILNKQIT
jgi:hypothetical protein